VPSLLEISDLHVRYGSLRALNGISLRVDRGEIVAVIGANGAGKSTLLNAISRIIPTAGGSLACDGTSLLGNSPQRVIQLGICQVPEGRRLFPELSVSDNLRLGAYSRFFRRWNFVGGWLSSIRSRNELEQDIDRVFSIFPRLAERRSQLAGTMSGGEQQMVAIGRALMARPRLLMLDEPSMGLAPRLVAELLAAVGRLRDFGLTVLLVEQNANQALQVSDRAYVLKDGRVDIEGTAGALRSNPGVRAAYLGAASFDQAQVSQ
jgi:branched-chain amino acid transport system ATP-binding protein